jgi:hypothetical protein
MGTKNFVYLVCNKIYGELIFQLSFTCESNIYVNFKDSIDINFDRDLFIYKFANLFLDGLIFNFGKILSTQFKIWSFYPLFTKPIKKY